MRVSVLTPIYKTDEGHLRETIEGVLAQTFRDFEFLLLDDCPDDDRERVVKSYGDSRIVYLKNDANLGIARSRNRLLDLARGEYVAVLDHDDVCHPDRFAREVAYLDAHPECGVVSSWVRRIPENLISKYPESDHEIKLNHMYRSVIQHSAAMIRKSALTANGIRYEEFFSPVEDYALWVRLGAHTRFHILQEPLLDYRWHGGNTSKVRADQLEDAYARVRALARTAYPELYAEYRIKEVRVDRIRLFGIPLLKVVRTERTTSVKLFNVVPIASTVRRWGLR